MHISSLHIHPIKSLQSVSVNELLTTDRGAKYDRRWMFIDASGSFITQRECVDLVHFELELEQDRIRVVHPKDSNGIIVPLSISSGEKTRVKIWNSKCDALVAEDHINRWFSKLLNMDLRLVYMPDESERRVDPEYAKQNELTAFTDGFPFLVIGQASLDDLNSKLEDPVPMDRFRPNIVFDGGEAFAEDDWKDVKIGSATFRRVKPCSRCVMTTTDQKTGERNKEPIRTLNTYRKQGNHVNFGQNLLCVGQGSIEIGNIITPT